MSTTVKSAFDILARNLEITGLQKTVASERQNNVRDVVAVEMNVLDSFLTGSYVRSTMIALLSGADLTLTCSQIPP